MLRAGQYIAILVFLFAISETLLAQTDASRVDSTDHGIVGAPFLQYAPETQLAFGAASLYYFHIRGDSLEDCVNIPSSISLGATYTLRHHFSTGMDSTQTFSHNNYYIYGGFEFQ